MEKSDISETLFSVKRVIRVIRTENNNYHKRAFIDGRPTDVFVYIISGSCDYRCEDGTCFTVKAGDIMYLPNGERYSVYINDKNYRYIFCDFEFNEAQPKRSAVFTPKNEFSAENLFVKLLNVYNSQTKTYYTDSLSLIYSIYSAIISSKSDTYTNKAVKTKMADAKKYIDVHYSDINLNISNMAKNFDMSEVYFRKLFKNEFGVSPSKYIISVRLKRAKNLMLYYPFLTIEECAKQSGFSSLQYFSRAFNKEFGINPSKYRKEKNNGGFSMR